MRDVINFRSRLYGSGSTQRTKGLKRVFVASLVLALSVGWSPNSVAVYIRHDRPVAAYNNIGLAPAYQAAGYMGFTGTPDPQCSGTLITSTHFLTASHCIDGNVDGISDYLASNLVVGFDVNLPVGGLGLNNVSQIFLNPNWDGSSWFDLAVLELSLPVPGITPAKILLKDERRQTGTMVGYGQQGDGFDASLTGAMIG